MRNAILLFLCPLSACGGPSTSDTPMPLPVEVAAVTQGVGGEGPSYPARISYDREVALSLRVGGMIRAMPVAIGQKLRAGALVATLDATPYRAALARADADARRTARDAVRDSALVSAGAISEIDAKDAADTAKSARATRVAASYDLSSARLTMPFAGVVLAKSTEIGAVIAPGQIVVKVADLASPLIARVAVPAETAWGIRPQRQASVSISGQNYVGHVLRVAAAADATSGTVEVDVAIAGNNAKSGIVSGAAGSVHFAEVRDVRGDTDQEQHIPAEALVDANGPVGHVFVVDPHKGIARLAAVRLLGPGEDDWRVSGLPSGAMVITAGAGFVSDGQRVSVLTR